ncbi:MAG: hypothetical protein K8823_22 [Cenarchaeum symbiont of Oopsacas minuta]|nr:hypothetical protein [Cenarchaeum symbiont of Oopsacas minuta]
MKLQKVLAYTYGDKSHFKYIITLPENLINQLKWKSGSELKAKKQDDKIQICFVSKPRKNIKSKSLEPKIPYSEFRDKTKSALEHRDNGATWTELREQLELEQIVPNNKWVRQLEKDIGLKRTRETNGVIWRINHV